MKLDQKVRGPQAAGQEEAARSRVENRAGAEQVAAAPARPDVAGREAAAKVETGEGGGIVVEHSLSEPKQLDILLAGGEEERFAPFVDGLCQKMDVAVHRRQTGAETLELLAAGWIDLVVLDERVSDMCGLDLAREVAMRHPFVGCALVSSLSADEFHEKSEGLGILMQLPNPPEADDGSALISHYLSITSQQDVGKREECEGQP
jgi:CheY-like chemotaxis protein